MTAAMDYYEALHSEENGEKKHSSLLVDVAADLYRVDREHLPKGPRGVVAVHKSAEAPHRALGKLE